MEGNVIHGECLKQVHVNSMCLHSLPPQSAVSWHWFSQWWPWGTNLNGTSAAILDLCCAVVAKWWRDAWVASLELSVRWGSIKIQTGHPAKVSVNWLYVNMLKHCKHTLGFFAGDFFESSVWHWPINLFLPYRIVAALPKARHPRCAWAGLPSSHASICQQHMCLTVSDS